MASTGWNRAQREEAYDRQNGVCCYCQGPMSSNTVQPVQSWMATVEHLTQKRFGGGAKPNNTVAACHGCNNARPNGMPPSHFAMLRLLLLRAWPPCTKAPAHVKRVLTDLMRAPKAKG